MNAGGVPAWIAVRSVQKRTFWQVGPAGMTEIVTSD
jgi:hypothetical protein